MLVLSRRVGEKIKVDGDITIVVTEIRADRVRLGVQAPESVSIHREEVWNQIVAGGGHWAFAHLFDGQSYLGPVKCATKRLAEAARKTHCDIRTSHWCMVTDSEDPPRVDKSIQRG